MPIQSTIKIELKEEIIDEPFVRGSLDLDEILDEDPEWKFSLSGQALLT